MRPIYLSYRLPVLPGGIIIVPGTEPSTTVTSVTMELEIRRAGRESPAIISLQDALNLIPGSSIELMTNTNSPIQKFFVLPASNIDCNEMCGGIDYYELLRVNARSATDEEKECIGNCISEDDYDHILGS